ncbi:hypothetical protein [Glaciecola sp. 1036]|uniref:hypothetical protein n=1 Tax=Alteromonadaceae TaxID=72275 RepID=UPI003D04D85E
MALRFKKFDPQTDIPVLYEMLQQRQHNISHTSLPSFEQHEKFCLEHPYREWLLVESDEQTIGSVYLTHNNAIGINLIKDVPDWYLQVIDYVAGHYECVKAEASITPSYFYLNVAPTNKVLMAALEQQQAQLIQHTYKL